MIKDLIKIANSLDRLGFTKEASEIDYLIKKVAQEKLPVLIIVSAFQFGPSLSIDIRGVAATSEVTWTKSFRGGQEKIEEAKNYFVEMKKQYPNVKIDTSKIGAPITKEMLGL